MLRSIVATQGKRLPRLAFGAVTQLARGLNIASQRLIRQRLRDAFRERAALRVVGIHRFQLVAVSPAQASSLWPSARITRLAFDPAVRHVFFGLLTTPPSPWIRAEPSTASVNLAYDCLKFL